MPYMTRTDAVAFLAEGTRTGKLATALAGTPHVAPVWFIVDGDDLVFTTAETSIKGRHLRANPRAALSVDLEEFPYSFVVVRGPVGLNPDASDIVVWATRIAARYVPTDQARAYGERNGVPGELLCRLHIERISGQHDVAL
jgi:PPOX class probable F420-dependent enzyme